MRKPPRELTIPANVPAGQTLNIDRSIIADFGLDLMATICYQNGLSANDISYQWMFDSDGYIDRIKVNNQPDSEALIIKISSL